MLKDLNEVYHEISNACDRLPQSGLRLSSKFIETYTRYIENTDSVPGGYVKVLFDEGSALLISNPTGTSDSVFTCVTTYGFALAHALIPLIRELSEYKSRVAQVLKSYSKSDIEIILKELRKNPASSGKLAVFNSALKILPSEEQVFVRKFVTDYSWWHGQKGIERDDFMYSPMLTCSKLVAASNGAIPTIAKHFFASKELYSTFSYSKRSVGSSETEPPPNVDRLSVALKLFAEKRKDDGEGGWFDTGFDVNANTRGYFDALTVDVLKGFGEEKITELFCGLKGSDGKTFEPMWSGKPGQGWGNIKPNDPEAVQKIVDFLVLLKSDASVSARFLDKDFVRPAGFGRSVISELLMKFHPDTCLKHGERSHVALAWLGLIDFDWRNDYSDAEYKQVCGAAAKILGKMVDMKLPRQIAADGTEDTSKPDYLTVNEFIYFVNTNQDLIKEKVMSKQWKSVNSKDKVKNGTRKLSDALSGNDMLKRLVAALRTKPFAILAGHSGTGKSQLVRRLAYMTCNNELLIKEGEGKTAPGNYCMVQVKPNWHDSTDLLGYYSEMGERHFVNTPFVEFICKAYAYPETPFFVCLDEMNLAPVEQYFAEYLSAIESMENKGGVWLTDPLVEVDKTGEKDASGKEKVDVEIVDQIMKGAASKEAADWIQAHGLTIPKNLFVVGTVNMDETTCQFSRKVLDRAMTLLMNDVKFSDMGASKKPSDEELLDEAGLDFFLEGEERGTVGAAESALLDGINEPLANTPFVVAYRFANEYALYEAALAKLDGVDLAAANEEEKKKYAMEALDHVVMMKLLPRIHGERSTVRVLFEGGKRGDKNVPGLESKLPSGELSVDMMKKILERRDEYLTFWP